MTPMSVAVRLWDAAAASCTEASGASAVIDVVLVRLESGLRRWIGAEGYAALLSRTVANVVHTHPALAGIADLGANGGDQAVTSPHGASDGADAAQRDAVIALLNAMMLHLGGIIGDTMAIRLFEQTIIPSQRGTAGAESKESPS